MRVLAFVAHPDDAALICGGTLARYSRAGHQVSIAVLCQGESPPVGIPPEELRAQREAEVRRSAALINATVYLLGYPDLHPPAEEEARPRAVEMIRQVDPEVVLTHYPQDPLKDHRRASELVEASVAVAWHPAIVTHTPPCTRHSVLYYMDTISGLNFEPDEFVDITGVFDLKRRMLECHEIEAAEYRGHPVFDTMEWVEVTARYRGV
jgi:LmbE family N-acetylglucosaminyl deacetylase